MKAALSIPIKDDFDRLIRVSSDITGRKQDNRYDVNGIRKRKLDSNGNASSEFTAGISTVASKAATSGSSAPTISYIMGHQLLGCEVDGAFQYWLNDHLGTVRDVVDENGDVIQSYEFNEHGIPMPGSGAGSGTFAPKTYQGALSVNDDRADSGLYLMGHRHFDPTLGRFISRDPIGFRGGLNLYGTAFGNNPMTFVDPSGKEAWIVYADGTPAYFSSDNFGLFLHRVQCASAGDIKGLVIARHGTPKGIYPQQGQNTGIKYDPSDKSFSITYKHTDGSIRDFNFNDLGLQSKGLEFIELRGCSTAGGAPNAAAQRAANPGHDYLYPDPTEDNISNALSKILPGTKVTGQVGPWEFHDEALKQPSLDEFNRIDPFSNPQTYLNGGKI